MRGNLLEMIFTDFLSSILRNTDTCLSYEEIMDGTDLTKCTVQRHMRQLEMDSLIATEHPGVSRAYRLTEYRYERKKYGKQIKDESTKEK